MTLYTFVAWVVYVALWYTGALPSLAGYYRNFRVEKAVKGLPVVVGPIMCVFELPNRRVSLMVKC